MPSAGPFVLTVEGGNACGCGGVRAECHAMSSNLAAPAPLGPGP